VDRLREVGFVEGRNLVIEFRSAQGRIDRLPELASDLAQQNCDVFLSPGNERNLAAIKQASRDTPIVMVAIDYDPVATGHISSLARPGGRITGVSAQQTDLVAKRLELLKEVLPRAKRIAVFSDTSTVGQLKAVQAGARRVPSGWASRCRSLSSHARRTTTKAPSPNRYARGPRRCWSSPPGTLYPHADRFRNWR
jgi:ABC-type uncharacterized transport system substrate-binding protein